MPLPRTSADPTDATEAARILRKKSILLSSDFAKLDRETKKRAFTVTEQVSFDAIRDMRNALAKAKADGIEYSEFVKTVGPKLHAQWGVDSPQLKTIFVNNVQQAANQAIVARLNRQRGKYPYWTLDIVNDEVTSATCGYFVTFPVVLPAGHPWFAANAPMRHHRCRTTLRGLTAAEARKIGISKTPPDWPADEGWGGSAPMGEYKATMADKAKTMSKRINADLGQADVHTDRPLGKVLKRKPKKLPAKYSAKMRAKLGQAAPQKRTFKFAFARGGTRIDVRHMRDSSHVVMRGEDALLPGIALGAELLAECKTVGDIGAENIDLSKWSPPRWNQLAKVGTFRGHPSGLFELTPSIFEEIARNFNATINKRVPIDYEHASEQPSTEGSIPTEGAPAHGWIVTMENRGRAGLWGLTTLHPRAAQKVREGQYMFFSPAIRFSSKDRETGQPIGARMTSGALTNNPFLDGMTPFLASDRGAGAAVDSTETITNMADYAHSMAEMAPKLRACLFDTGTHQASMGTLAECYDAVCRLEALVDEFREANADADLMTAKHAGIDLGGALMRLRDAMQLGLGITVPEMLTLVKEMIETAMGVHVEERHTDELPASSRDMRDTSMADEVLKLRDAETKLATLMSEKAVLANENQTLNTKVAGLELRLADRDSKLTAAETELKTLRDADTARKNADEIAAVDTAFATYKDAKQLTDANKKQMLLTYRNDRPLFDELYPMVAPDQRHLMRQIAPPAARPSPQQGAADARAIVGGGKSPDDMIQLADKYEKEGMSKEAALNKAYTESVAPKRQGAQPYR
jgi:hypothetical protein